MIYEMGGGVCAFSREARPWRISGTRKARMM
jgi:hypothetical protein